MIQRPVVIVSLLFATMWCAWAADSRLDGRLTDTDARSVSEPRLRLRTLLGQTSMDATSDPDGKFIFPAISPGSTN